MPPVNDLIIKGNLPKKSAGVRPQFVRLHAKKGKWGFMKNDCGEHGMQKKIV